MDKSALKVVIVLHVTSQRADLYKLLFFFLHFIESSSSNSWSFNDTIFVIVHL